MKSFGRAHGVLLMGGGLAIGSMLLGACSDYGSGDDPPPPAGDAGAETGVATEDGGITSATPGLSISERRLTFGFRCATGLGSKTADISLKNDSDKPIPFTLKLDDNPVFALVESAGEIPAHGMRVVTVAASGQAQSPLATATLHVLTGEADDPILLTATTDGPRLTIEPANADFGFVRANAASPPLALTLTNSGTEPVTITAFAPATTDFVFGTNLVVPAGGTLTPSVTMAAGAVGAPVKASVHPETSDVLCGDVPALTLTGERVANDVLVNPAIVDFGSAPCNSSPATTSKIVVSNYKVEPVPFTATLAATSQFTVSPANGSVPAAIAGAPGKIELTIGMKKLPASAPASPFTETLTVVTPGTSSPVTLRVKPVGAILALSPTDLDFTKNGTKYVTVTNQGNTAICALLTFNPGDNAITAEPASPTPAFLAVGNSSIAVRFSAQNQQGHRATLVMTPVSCGGSVPVTAACAALPPLPVHGKR